MTEISGQFQISKQVSNFMNFRTAVSITSAWASLDTLSDCSFCCSMSTSQWRNGQPVCGKTVKRGTE